MKSILERGIEELAYDLDESIERYPDVVKKREKSDAFLSDIKKRIGHEKFMRLHDAIFDARSAAAFAGFRIGLTEGLKLGNSVRTLLDSEGVDRNEQNHS